MPPGTAASALVFNVAVIELLVACSSPRTGVELRSCGWPFGAAGVVVDGAVLDVDGLDVDGLEFDVDGLGVDVAAEGAPPAIRPPTSAGAGRDSRECRAARLVRADVPGKSAPRRSL